MADMVFQIYQGASLMTIATAGRGEVQVLNHFRKKKEILKKQYESVLPLWNKLREKIATQKISKEA